MRGDIAQLMQQAQKMQENMQRAQEEIGALEATGNAGGGMVSVTIGGRMTAARCASIPRCSPIRRWPRTWSRRRSTMR